MPRYFEHGPNHFGFFSFDCAERPHVHVRSGKREMKVWIDEVEVVWNRGFPAQDVTKVIRIIRERQTEMLEKWSEHCS